MNKPNIPRITKPNLWRITKPYQTYQELPNIGRITKLNLTYQKWTDSKDVHRTKRQALTIVKLTHSRYTTKIARIRYTTKYLFLFSLFFFTISVYIKCQDVQTYSVFLLVMIHLCQGLRSYLYLQHNHIAAGGHHQLITFWLVSWCLASFKIHNDLCPGGSVYLAEWP